MMRGVCSRTPRSRASGHVDVDIALGGGERGCGGGTRWRGGRDGSRPRARRGPAWCCEALRGFSCAFDEGDVAGVAQDLLARPEMENDELMDEGVHLTPGVAELDVELLQKFEAVLRCVVAHSLRNAEGGRVFHRRHPNLVRGDGIGGRWRGWCSRQARPGTVLPRERASRRSRARTRKCGAL